MEWLVMVSALTIGAVVCAAAPARQRGWWVGGAAIAIVAVIAAGRSWAGRQAAEQERQSTRGRLAPAEDARGDYVSSDTCRACHPNQYHSWHSSYHRTMTQFATPDSVLADLSETTITVDEQPCRVFGKDGELWAEIPDPDWIHEERRREAALGRTERPSRQRARVAPPRVQVRVEMVTGSHHYQAYWVPSRMRANTQFILPLAWLIEDRRWVPRTDTFLRPPDKPAPVQVWNVNCIRCHATAGEPNRRDANEEVFETRVAEMGIACEACHGPAKDHVAHHRNPLRRYAGRQRATDGDPTIVNPAKLNPALSSRVCGSCHSVTSVHDWEGFVTGPHLFRPGDDSDPRAVMVRPRELAEDPESKMSMREHAEFFDSMFWRDGIVRVTGREFSGMIESRCHQDGALSCLSCHSMHQSEPDDQLAAGMRTNQACFTCHDDLRGKVPEHTRHGADSAGSLCYNCHMPHNTYGLLKAVRNHYIDSPSAAVSRETGRPNACNLCHLDRSLAWTAVRLNEWFDQPMPDLTVAEREVSDAVRLLIQGDAAQRALVAWNFGQALVRGAADPDWMVPHLAQALSDPYSAVRYIAAKSLGRLIGFDAVQFDYTGDPDSHAPTIEGIMRDWGEAATDLRPDPGLLILEGGGFDTNRFRALLEARDDRDVELSE